MSENVYNTSKLAFHKPKLESFARGEITAPIYVRVKPTNKCNHKCFYCSYAPGSTCPVSENINLKDEISRRKMMEILEDFKEIGVRAITYSGGGEPLIYPHITEALEKTLENKIQLSIITNGQLLTGKRAELLANAEWVRISADYCDAETFAEIRKRPPKWFELLIGNMQRFAEIKSPECEFGINFVVQERNARKIYDSAKLFKSLGLNHIKITPCYVDDFLGYHKDIKDIAEEQIARARQDFQDNSFTVYDTYENDFNLTGLHSRAYSKCYIMQVVPVIGADETVYFCHDKTYSGNGALGSIKERRFKDLWFSPETAEVFRTFNARESCPHHCTYDSRNILTPELLRHLDDLTPFQPKSDRHKDFI